MAGGPDLKARWTDDFSGLPPDSLGRWLPLFLIFPGSVPVRLVLASLSVHSAIPHAPAFPVYHRPKGFPVLVRLMFLTISAFQMRSGLAPSAAYAMPSADHSLALAGGSYESFRVISA